MPYHDIQVNQLPSMLGKQEVFILDMRDKHSYELEHIDGAQLATDESIVKIIRSREKQIPVLVYCYHGISSRDLASFFSSQGFKNVFSLAGGWQAWKSFSETSSLTVPDDLQTWLSEQGFELNNINSRIDNGMTPLMQASRQNNEQLVKKVLSCKPHVNLVNNDGNNALWFACFNNNIQLIKLLIEQGVPIDNINVNSATCLIFAASAGKLDVVKCLVESGASLTIRTLDGFNALDSASSYDVLKYLKPKYLNH